MRRHESITLKILSLIEESEHNLGREDIYREIQRHNSNLSDRLLQHHMLLAEEGELVAMFNGQGFRLTNEGHDHLDAKRNVARNADASIPHIRA